jgi:NADH-quinone oxidoreductase subunit C
VSEPAAPGTEPQEAETEAEPELLHGCPVTWSRGQQIVHVGPDGYLELMRALREDGFGLCVDVTAVDYLVHPGRELPDGVAAERFEVVVHLLDLTAPRRLRVRVQVPGDPPAVPSLFELWPGSDAMEREVYDLMGIRFDDHPDLTRILMPEDWEGHPLRKDYPTSNIPIQFKASPAAR